MIKVGLTGNIGSGKSTVARIFEILSVPVYHADKEAKKFLSKPEVKQELKNEFGKTIFSGIEIDRKKLAEIVFNNKKSLNFLNSIIHPLVRTDFEDWCSNHSKAAYVIQEAAILFESGFNKFFDKTIVVSCPEEIAVKRVMERDSATEKEVVERMKNQWAQERKIQLADFIIENDNNSFVINQVLKIDKALRS
jgi:dephospho-CoA kinase